jgi:hypothetical protein
MKALFKHENGRLKITRITFFVFLLLLISFSIVYKMGKSADKVFVSIEHVFEPLQSDPTPEPEPDVEPVTKSKEKPEPAPDPKPVEKAMPEPDVKPVEPPESIAISKPLKEIKPLDKAVHEAGHEVKNQMVDPTPSELKTLDEKVLDEKEKIVQKPQAKNIRLFTGEMQKLIDDKIMVDEPEKEGLNLSSKKYFEVYKQWQDQGVSLDKGKKLVALRIQNLEKVYELFQMKAVVLKENTPHTDIGDGSRIAVPSLSEFSSTCFVVSDPWKKWGRTLEDKGFSRSDDIEVRYYTYDFVRNAIYARAMKAFEWSLKKKNMPLTTDPAQADVLGIVYSVNKDGGGAFGVFVPKRVDFKSQDSVIIDPLVCFAGQKDIVELNRAGLL